MALTNPVQLNEASETEARITPPTMGNSDATTARLGTVPRNNQESMTEKKGSKALMVCVNETATDPSEMLVVRNPAECRKASGHTAVQVALEIRPGFFLMFVIQRNSMTRAPTATCAAVHVAG
mmetsp:Transcript_2810/g.17475  ORF Transcript_2810/g.17475 Transcript_2810/m.17475 type:complete len:123 (-) Transcript_2810:348-716(-)